MSDKLKRNFFFQVLLTLFNVLFPLIIMPYIFRVLGPEKMGLFSFFDSFVTFFIIGGLIGIPTYGFRELGKYKDDNCKRSKLVSELITIGIFSNILISIIYYLVIFYLYYSDPLKFSISAILGLRLLINIFVVDWVYQGIEEFKFISIRVIFLRLINCIFIFALVKNSNNVIEYAAITVFYFFTEAIISFFSLKKFKINIKINDLEIWRHVKPLCYVLVMSNSYFLFRSFDKLALGFGDFTSEVAFYRTGEGVINIIYQLLITIAFVSVPHLVRLAKTDFKEFNKYLTKLYSFLLYLAVPACFGLFILSEEVVLIYAGEQYLSAALSLKIFSVYMLFLVIQGFFSSQVLFILNKEKVIIKFFFITGFINVFLKVVFNKYLNSDNVILMTLIMQIILTYLIYYYAKTKLSINVKIINNQILFYIIIASSFYIIKLLVFNLLPIIYLNTIVTIILCGFYYFTLLHIFNDNNSIYVVKVARDTLNKYNILPNKIIK